MRVKWDSIDSCVFSVHVSFFFDCVWFPRFLFASCFAVRGCNTYFFFFVCLFVFVTIVPILSSLLSTHLEWRPHFFIFFFFLERGKNSYGSSID